MSRCGSGFTLRFFKTVHDCLEPDLLGGGLQCLYRWGMPNRSLFPVVQDVIGRIDYTDAKRPKQGASRIQRTVERPPVLPLKGLESLVGDCAHLRSMLSGMVVWCVTPGAGNLCPSTITYLDDGYGPSPAEKW